MLQTHHVYRHINPTTFETFYIGIGVNNRAYSKACRNKFWHSYIRKHGLIVDIIATGLTREQAAKMEIELIAHYGKRIDGGMLVNISDGGENGLYGIPRTKEHNEKIGKSQIGKIVTDETRHKQSIAKIGHKPTPETVSKIIAKNIGKKRSAETKAKNKIANSRKRKPQTAAHIKARRISGAFDRAKKPILCLNNGIIYESAKAASLSLNISDKHIGSVCNGKRNHVTGYKFVHK